MTTFDKRHRPDRGVDFVLNEEYRKYDQVNQSTPLSDQLAYYEMCASRAKKLLELKERYAAREWSARWGKGGICSKQVNALVTHCEIRHNCGCCNDSPIEVFPYIEMDGVRIYSDPEVFSPGWKNPPGGDEPRPNWESGFLKHGISPTIIEQVRKHFEQNKPLPYDYEDEDPDDED